MDTVPTAQGADAGRIQLLGTFAAKSLEQAYRARFLPDDLWLARACMLAAMARVLLFGVLDDQPQTARDFWLYAGWRAAFVALSACVLVSLRSLDRLFFGWCLLLGLLTISFIALKIPGDARATYMTLASVLLIYAILPLPLVAQMLAAIPFSLSVLGMLMATDRHAAIALGGAFALANTVGIIISSQLQRRRRMWYLSSLREAQLRGELEQALAEVKTLRGQIPICAWCKKIRDEKNTWQPVESYVTQRTYADFSHGMCPNCAHEQLRQATALAKCSR